MNRIRPGQLVYWHNEPAIVMELKGLSEVILRTIENSRTEIALASSLSISPESSDPGKSIASHLLAEDKDWNQALERHEIIKPLLYKQGRSEQDVKAVAEKTGKTSTTIYRWIKRFEETGLVSSLLRSPRSDKGEQKLNSEVEEIISKNLGEYYLTKERPSPTKLYQRIKLECQEVDLIAPHRNTIYRRVKMINEREAVSRRFSSKTAREKYEPIRGAFPGADYPNAVVQIDHTKMDIVIVDEEHRLPIGRPYLTIAIDVASKMISGFRMTLDPPGASSAGLCIAHAVMKKEQWLAKEDFDAEWPIYGLMRMIHLDNAKEFRGKMLERACEQHGIILENRPKGMPNYGPHVERAFRTYMQEVHSLPGTTFSSVARKLDYDSEGRACLTLKELELWFTVFIVYQYHHKPHKGNKGVSPIKMYHKYIHGDSETPGIGLPVSIDDEETFRLDFTPYVERAVQRQGVVIDNIHYYSPVLRRWVNTKDETSKKARKFIFARDPRDISRIYFYDPDTQSYVAVPYLNNTRPEMSLWELKAITNDLSKMDSDINEEMIFKDLKKMREIEDIAIEKTRLAKQQRAGEKRKRRMAERRNKWTDVHPAEKSSIDQLVNQEDSDDIQPFTDIELG